MVELIRKIKSRFLKSSMKSTILWKSSRKKKKKAYTVSETNIDTYTQTLQLFIEITRF